MKTCPKCAYQRTDKDSATPDYECPKCGVIYNKAEKNLEMLQNLKLIENAKKQERQNRFKKLAKKKELLLVNIKKIFLFSKGKPFASAIVLLFIFFGITFGYLYFQKKEQQDLYLTKLHLANALIPMAVASCTEMYETYSGEWRRAINDREDFNNVISLIHAAYLDTGAINQIERQKEDIENILKDLNALPDNLPEAHKKTIELFGIYSQLNSLATAPSGSLMSYNNKFHELQSSLISKLNEIKVTLPQNEKINEAVSNFVKEYTSNETQVTLKQNEKLNEMTKAIKAMSEDIKKNHKNKLQ